MLTPATDGCHPCHVGRSAGPDRSPLGRAAGSAYGLLMERPPSKKASRELLEKVVEGGVSMIPIAGGPVAVAFAYAVGQAHNRRMQVWLENLADVVADLQTRLGGIDFDTLAEDERFIDAVVSATRAAQATHDEEKLTALRNGVLNTLGPNAPTEDEQLRFFRFVEQFSPAHLRLLRFFHDPGAGFDAAGITRPGYLAGGRATLLEDGMPEFRDKREWSALLFGDLYTAGLTNGALGDMQSGESLWLSATSPLGDRFLAFVSNPPGTVDGLEA